MPATSTTPTTPRINFAALENAVDDLERQFVGGHPDDVHGGHRTPAHGVDVRERIGRRNLPVKVGIIDDGGEKVDRLDQGAVGIEPINGRVVGGRRTDEQIVIRDLGEIAQDLRKFGGAELGRSSGTGGHGSEFADFVARHAGTIAGNRRSASAGVAWNSGNALMTSEGASRFHRFAAVRGLLSRRDISS